MIKNHLKNVIALGIIATSVIALNPIGASASWKQNNSGWRYTEGNSYANGWRNIDGNWYYFSPISGYMFIQTTVDGCYVNDNGAWVDDSNFNVKASEAEELVRDNYYHGTSLTNPYIRCCGFDGNKWTVRAFEDDQYKTTNIGWYYVGSDTGNIMKKN